MKINSWGDDITIYSLLTNDNPYKEGKLEYYLVQYMIEYLSLERNDGITSVKILDYLTTQKYEVENIDSWNLDKLKDYVISLCKLNGIIRIKNTTSSNLNFGIYIEDGLVNPINNINFTKALKNLKDIKKRNELWEVLHINERIREIYGLPEIKSNLSGYQLRLPHHAGAWEVGSIPISAWSYPGSDEGWLGLNSRGLFHHMGDEMAFVINALCYGDCYIVGRDEFNDLIVLGVLNNDIKGDFKLYQKVSTSDFTYIYGVPKGQELVMSKSAFIVDSKNDCKINDEKNSEVEDFWNNEVFLEFSKRKCGGYSFNQMADLIEKNALKCLSSFNFDLKKLEKFSLDQDDVKNIKETIALSKNYINLSCIEGIGGENARFLEDWNEVESSIFSSNIKNIFKCLSGIENNIKNNTYNKYIKEHEYFSNHVGVYISNKITTIRKKLLKIPYLKKYINGKLDEVKKSTYEATSLFYKTKNHKVHCDIINPKASLELGFFNKNEVTDNNFTEVDYLDYLFSKVFCNIIKNEDSDLSFNTYLLKKLSSGLNGNAEKLIKYWKNIDSNSFFVSEIKKMENEYRVFVINNRAVATSPCFRNTTPFNAWNNGRFDPRLANGHNAKDVILNQETRNRVAKYAKFVRKFTKKMKEKYPQYKNYVLDIAWSEDVNDVIPIEINSITWSGAYQINFGRLCSAIANVKYNYLNIISNTYKVIRGKEFTTESMLYKASLLEYKHTAQTKMLKTEKITSFDLSLNGLERVLLSGNYDIPSFFSDFNEIKDNKKILKFIENKSIISNTILLNEDLMGDGKEVGFLNENKELIDNLDNIIDKHIDDDNSTDIKVY